MIEKLYELEDDKGLFVQASWRPEGYCYWYWLAICAKGSP
jgi:hypothetical protein